MTERNHETDVQSVTVNRNADGTLRSTKYTAPITVRAAHYVTEGEGDDAEFFKSWEGRLKYQIGDGVAKVVQFKDMDGSDCGSDWTGFGFLRLLAGVERAVENVDGVDRVERAEETLGRQLEKGRSADLDPE